MSQHIVLHSHKDRKWVFGWDQMLQSFFLQVHDLTCHEDDEQNPRIIAWLGASPETTMYEVEDLVREAKKNGLEIPYEAQVALYGEKDDGR